MEIISIQENKDCIICFNSYTNDNYIIFDCKHEVCVYCYQKLLNSNKLLCPLCRIIITDNIHINSSYKNNIIQPYDINNVPIVNVYENINNSINDNINQYTIVKVSLCIILLFVIIIITIFIINYT